MSTHTHWRIYFTKGICGFERKLGDGDTYEAALLRWQERLLPEMGVFVKRIQKVYGGWEVAGPRT